MAFAQGSRSSLSYIVESTFGTTPAGNFTTLPFTSHSLNLTKDIMEEMTFKLTVCLELTGKVTDKQAEI